MPHAHVRPFLSRSSDVLRGVLPGRPHNSRSPRRQYDAVFFQPAVGELLALEARPAGGAEVQILAVARGLAEQGVSVGVIAQGPANDLPLRIDGVEILPLWDLTPQRYPGFRWVRRIVRVWRTVRLLMRTRAHTFVQRSAGRVTGLVAVVARAKGSRFVYSSANVVDFDFRRIDDSAVSFALFRLGIWLANSLVVQSNEQRQLCQARFGRGSLVARSVASTADSQGRSPEAFIWIGRLADYKRPELFVRMARDCPELPCWLLGVPVGPDAQRLEAELRSASREIPNLKLLPPRSHDEMGALLSHAVAVVNTALFEGMPNIFLEGWSRGIPALAHSHDPDGVIVEKGLGGFAAGSDERFAQLARQLWATRANQAALSGRCRSYIAREHSLHPVLNIWTQALELDASAGAVDPLPGSTLSKPGL